MEGDATITIGDSVSGENSDGQSANIILTQDNSSGTRDIHITAGPAGAAPNRLGLVITDEDENMVDVNINDLSSLTNPAQTTIKLQEIQFSSNGQIVRAVALICTPYQSTDDNPKLIVFDENGLANPFDCTVVNGQASFVPGAGQNLVPGNMFTPQAVPAGGLSYVFLRLNTDGKSVQNCTLMIGSTAPVSPVPVKDALPQQVDVLLHLIAYTAPTGNATVGTYTPYRVFYPATNIVLTPILAFQTSVDNPQPGGPAYDNWYTWQIGGT